MEFESYETTNLKNSNVILNNFKARFPDHPVWDDPCQGSVYTSDGLGMFHCYCSQFGLEQFYVKFIEWMGSSESAEDFCRKLSDEVLKAYAER
jgi:hypothetical protein